MTAGRIKIQPNPVASRIVPRMSPQEPGQALLQRTVPDMATISTTTGDETAHTTLHSRTLRRMTLNSTSLVTAASKESCGRFTRLQHRGLKPYLVKMQESFSQIFVKGVVDRLRQFYTSSINNTAAVLTTTHRQFASEMDCMLKECREK